MGLNEVLQDYVNLSYGELLSVAAHAAKTVIPFFNSAVEDGDGAIFTISFIGVSLASDGQLTSLEKKFVCDLFNVDGATVDGIFKSINSEIIRIVHEVFDSIPTDEVKAALLSFCACFLAVDERVTREEFAFLQKLIA